MINENMFKLIDKICFKYHKSIILTLDRVIERERDYGILEARNKVFNKTYYYQALSSVCNDYKNWNKNKIEELYKNEIKR